MTYTTMMIVFAVFVPLTQNDALEYAMVGRVLFDTRDLLSYPVLSLGAGNFGFYAPWTPAPVCFNDIYNQCHQGTLTFQD